VIIINIERKYGIRSYRHSLHGSWPNQYWIIKAEIIVKEIIERIIIRNILFDCFSIIYLRIK
jgi:hypothetical protein